MPAYKDEKKGTWYVSFHYFDWTGKNVRKLKRGFATKRKAQEWEQSFLRTKAASMDALKLWERYYGDARFAEDFHGYLMCRDGYGNPDFFIKEDGEAIYCGWNIHHILPKNCGGTNAISNLTCTNIATNDEAADKITFWIDDCLYQVQRTCDGHGIFQLN